MQPIALCLDRVIKKSSDSYECKGATLDLCSLPTIREKGDMSGAWRNQTLWGGKQIRADSTSLAGWGGPGPHMLSQCLPIFHAVTQSKWWYLFADWRKKGETAFCWRLLAPEQSSAAPGLMRLCMSGGISTLVGISMVYFAPQLGAQKMLWYSQGDLMESSAGKTIGLQLQWVLWLPSLSMGRESCKSDNVITSHSERLASVFLRRAHKTRTSPLFSSLSPIAVSFFF